MHGYGSGPTPHDGDDQFGGGQQFPAGFGRGGDRRGRGPRGRGGPGRGPGPGGRGRRGGRRPRVSRGDVRVGVLALLKDEPMHGYQIMQELDERSGGAWQPSPGSIYPTLQQLADEGLIVSQSVDGKNVFSLTEDGAAEVEGDESPPPWERLNVEGGAVYANLRRSMFQLGAATRQVAAAGSHSQAEAAAQIINDAKKAIYRLLAEDDAPGSES